MGVRSARLAGSKKYGSKREFSREDFRPLCPFNGRFLCRTTAALARAVELGGAAIPTTARFVIVMQTGIAAHATEQRFGAFISQAVRMRTATVSALFIDAAGAVSLLDSSRNMPLERLRSLSGRAAV
jgi:hypothetical protein